MTIAYIISIIIGIVIIAGMFFYFYYFFPLRPTEQGIKYVYVEEDGSVREIDEGDIEYLKSEFDPSDSARPYIKQSYSQLSPDKKISGFILRRRVPRKIKIAPFSQQKDHQIISWIFLAIAMASEKAPTDLNGIKMVADGINHAIPSDNEIRLSESWLLKHSLIEKEGKKYSLSESGTLLYKNAAVKNSAIMTIWKELETTFKEYA